MQIGTENRNKTIAAVSLTVLALVLVLWRLFPSSPSPSASTAITSSAPASAPVAHRAASGRKTAAPALRSLDPTLRLDWLKQSEDMKYEGIGRNIFQAKVEIPKPVAPVITPPSTPAAQGPPPPPPILLKFYGFASKPGEPRKVFLSKDGDVFIAGEGDIIDRRYRVLRITPMSVEIEDVLSNNRQSIPLTQG
jgi:hypothetical protein